MLWFEELHGELKKLEEYFGKKLNEIQMQTYIDELRPLDKFQVRAAVTLLCRERKPVTGQFPTPNDISKMASPYNSDRPVTTTEDISHLVRAADQLEKTGEFDREGLNHQDVARILARVNCRFRLVAKVSQEGLAYFDLYKDGKFVHSGLEAARRVKRPARGDINFSEKTFS